jgi:hypothetical protein
MNKCTGCRKEHTLEHFMKNNKLLKKCIKCRTENKIWKENNKERIFLYNNLYRHNKTDKWKEIKEQNNIKDIVKGKPSKYRVLHETIENIIGKKCCSCKNWTPLDNYNYSKNHWDYLRNDCKDCLSKWRKKNREKINEKFKYYEKMRKKIDPKFKLIKTLRSRLGNALKRKHSIKNNTTLELIGCSPIFLISYLESKFTEGMTWDNHGKWHIDHIIPCCSFNLENEEEQKKCFHYTNLQPLWAKDNLRKGGKII